MNGVAVRRPCWDDKSKRLDAGMMVDWADLNADDWERVSSDEPVSEHEYTYRGDGMADKLVCYCGWESNTYFDGLEYALDEWKEHEAQMKIQNPASNDDFGYFCFLLGWLSSRSSFNADQAAWDAPPENLEVDPGRLYDMLREPDGVFYVSDLSQVLRQVYKQAKTRLPHPNYWRLYDKKGEVVSAEFRGKYYRFQVVHVVLGKMVFLQETTGALSSSIPMNYVKNIRVLT